MSIYHPSDLSRPADGGEVSRKSHLDLWTISPRALTFGRAACTADNGRVAIDIEHSSSGLTGLSESCRTELAQSLEAEPLFPGLCCCSLDEHILPARSHAKSESQLQRRVGIQSNDRVDSAGEADSVVGKGRWRPLFRGFQALISCKRNCTGWHVWIYSLDRA